MAEILPFLSGTLRTIVDQLAADGDIVAKEISRVDELNNQAISIQTFIPEKLSQAIKTKIIDTVLTGEVSMLTIRMDGSFLVSFLPKGKTPEYSRDGIWARKNRQEGRIGKVFQMALVKQFKQYDWEKFVNNLKSEVCTCNNFELVSGEDIRKWYHEQTYYSYNASLGNSCMRYDEAQSYFDVYVENAKMLITTKDGKLTGRAIVWEIDENTTILDRIYVCYDYLEQCFIDYAKEHKWIIRENNSLLHTGEEQFWRTPEDDYETSKRIPFKIKLKRQYDAFPYVDSFRYLSSDRLTLSTEVSDYALDSTNGEINGAAISCENCGRTFYGYDEEELPDELHWSEWSGSYLCDDCCFWSLYLDDYIPNTVDHVIIRTEPWCSENMITSDLDEHLVTNPKDASETDEPVIVKIEDAYYDIKYPGVFFNEDTKKYEIRPNSN